MGWLESVFDHVCGSANVWVLGGKVLPMCQRCTGLYVGAAVAMVAYLWLRPRPTRALVWFHTALLFGMIPFGYHWVEQSALVRTVTGFLFACGIVYALSLKPLSRWSVQQRDTPVAAGVFLAAALAVLLCGVSFGGAMTAGMIAWIGFLGLLGFVVSLGVSAWCLVR